MRIRTLFLLLLLNLSARIAWEQGQGYTNVTATKSCYGGGSVNATFVNQSGSPQLPLLNGSVFPTVGTTNINSNGTLSFYLADNLQIFPNPSQWSITVCAKPGGQPYCGNANITITGPTQDISSAISGFTCPPNGPNPPNTPFVGTAINGSIMQSPYTPVNQAGDTMSGPLVAPSTTTKQPVVSALHPDFGTPSSCPNVADPTGVNDSTCPINAALAYAASQCQAAGICMVEVPTGHYLISSSSLHVPAGVKLEGDGKNQTQFICPTLSNGGCINSLSTAAGITLGNFSITSTDMTTAGSVMAILLLGDDSTIDNVLAIGPGTGPRAGAPWTYANQSYGFVMNGNGATISNSKAYGWQGGALWCSLNNGCSAAQGATNAAPINAQFLNNNFHDNGYFGLNTDINTVNVLVQGGTYNCNGAAAGTTTPSGWPTVSCKGPVWNGIDGYGGTFHSANIKIIGANFWGNFRTQVDSHANMQQLVFIGNTVTITGLESSGNAVGSSFYGTVGSSIEESGNTFTGTPGFLGLAGFIIGGNPSIGTVNIHDNIIQNADFSAAPIYIRPTGPTATYNPPASVGVDHNYFANVKTNVNANILIEPNTQPAGLLNTPKVVTCNKNVGIDGASMCYIQSGWELHIEQNSMSCSAANRNSSCGDPVLLLSTAGNYTHVYTNGNSCSGCQAIRNLANGMSPNMTWETYMYPQLDHADANGNTYQIVTTPGTDGTLTGVVEQGMTAGSNTFLINSVSTLGPGQWINVSGQLWCTTSACIGNQAGGVILDVNPIAVGGFYQVTTTTNAVNTIASGTAVTYQNSVRVPMGGHVTAISGTPTVGNAACIKAYSAGPPPLATIGYCSTTPGAGGACTCN